MGDCDGIYFVVIIVVVKKGGENVVDVVKVVEVCLVSFEN